MKYTNKELKELVAEECGWTRRKVRLDDEWSHEDGKYVDIWSYGGRQVRTEDLPDYTGSLDAIYEAWVMLSHNQKLLFMDYLWDEVKKDYQPKTWAILPQNQKESIVSNATALQRARTFVKVRKENA